MTEPTVAVGSLQESWYLRKADILKRLTKDETDTLYANSARVTKARGEEIWPDDDEASPKAYIIDQGYLRVCRMSDDGKRFILAMLGPGDFFGALTDTPKEPDSDDSNDEYWEVVRDVRLIAVEASVFHKTLSNHPDMVMRLAQMLEQRRRLLEKRVTSLLFKDVCARTAEVIMEFCRKFGEPCPDNPADLWAFSLTHQELADLVGAARPVVSSVVSDMTKAGVVEKHGRLLCVHNKEQLQTLVEMGNKGLNF